MGVLSAILHMRNSRRRVAAETEPEEPTAPATEPAADDGDPEDKAVIRPLQQRVAPPSYTPKPRPKNPDAANAADPIVVAEMCTAAGWPDLTAHLVKARLSVEAAKTRLANADEIERVWQQAPALCARFDAETADTIARALIRDGSSPAGAKAIRDKMISAVNAGIASNGWTH